MKKQPKILVVGSINIDFVIETAVFPKEGETVSGSGFKKAAGGKGANQAVQAARLGADTCMVGAVGNDADGKEMKSLLAAEGIDVSCVAEKNLPTGCAVIVLHGTQNRIIVYSGANGGLNERDVAHLKDAICGYDMVVLQHEIPMAINEVVARYAHECGVPVFLNTAPYAPLSSELLSHVTYLCANETEAQSLSGIEVIAGTDTVRLAAEKILSLGVSNVLLTLGSAGAYFLGCGNECFSPAKSDIKVVDTTAAGDSFIGGFVYALTSGMDLEKALMFANHTAAITVSKMGAIPSLPTISEVESIL